MSLVAIGVCRRAFGTDGAIRVESFSGEYDHFSLIKVLTVRKGPKSQTHTVEYWHIGEFRSFVKFRDIDTPESAKQLTGWELWVPEQFSCPLEDGEWYVRDIRGTTVHADGTQVGIVKDIIDIGRAQYLEMKGLDNQNFLIPLNDSFVDEFSPKKVVLRHAWILQ